MIVPIYRYIVHEISPVVGVVYSGQMAYFNCVTTTTDFPVDLGFVPAVVLTFGSNHYYLYCCYCI